MLQPFVPEIVADGEWSFLYFGKKFSHAVVKTAKLGEFRDQWTLGGTHKKLEASAALQEQVDAIFEKLDPLCGGGRLYTRISGLVQNGQFLVTEIELTEPYLFMAEDSNAPD